MNCKHKLNEERNKCILCGTKVLGIAKKDLNCGDDIITLVMEDGCLKSNEINYLESITEEELK